jgi:hypothetical protein
MDCGYMCNASGNPPPIYSKNKVRADDNRKISAYILARFTRACANQHWSVLTLRVKFMENSKQPILKWNNRYCIRAYP